MLSQIIHTRSCQVYICPVRKLNKYFPGNNFARLLNPDEVLVIDSHNPRLNLRERFFFTPRAPQP